MAEQRKHLRLPLESTAFIELVSPRAGQPGSGHVVTCTSLNVSRGGLHVALDEALTVGAILQIGVDLAGAEDTLYLAGEVRWCLPGKTEQKDWIAGFKILNADNSDVERWANMIAEMEA
jgi:Tfp pilus assembly protein PilZ